MNVARGEAWMLYCRHRLPARLEVTIARGERSFESEFKVHQGRAYDFSIFGRLLDEEYLLEAFGRNRRPEDESESELVFTGTFEHQNGCSGDFTARPTADGELMRLGVYGTDPVITLNRVNRRWRNGPVELWGVPNLSLRLESDLNLPELVIPRHYVGVVKTHGNEAGGGPPMVAVLATLVLCYEEILTQHYLTAD